MASARSRLTGFHGSLPPCHQAIRQDLREDGPKLIAFADALSAIIRKRSFLSVVRQRRHHPRRRRASSVRSSAKLPHPVM
jgi:hypothetical protein